MWGNNLNAFQSEQWINSKCRLVWRQVYKYFNYQFICKINPASCPESVTVSQDNTRQTQTAPRHLKCVSAVQRGRQLVSGETAGKSRPGQRQVNDMKLKLKERHGVTVKRLPRHTSNSAVEVKGSDQQELFKEDPTRERSSFWNQRATWSLAAPSLSINNPGGRQQLSDLT